MLTIHLAYSRSGEPLPYITKDGERTADKKQAVKSKSYEKLEQLAEKFNLADHEYKIDNL